MACVFDDINVGVTPLFTSPTNPPVNRSIQMVTNHDMNDSRFVTIGESHGSG